MDIPSLEARVSYCDTKIIELLADKALPDNLVRQRIKFWEFQSRLAESKITSIYDAIKILKKEEENVGWRGAIPEVHGGGDETMGS